MARRGNVTLSDMTVTAVDNRKTPGTSRLVATKGPYTLTIEKAGAFPDDLIARPDDTIDVQFAYDPKVTA